MIDRLHHYMRELRLLRKAMEAARKQKRSFDDGWAQNRDEMKAMAAEITALKHKAESMVSESDAKTKVSESDANTMVSETDTKID